MMKNKYTPITFLISELPTKKADSLCIKPEGGCLGFATAALVLVLAVARLEEKDLFNNLTLIRENRSITILCPIHPAVGCL